VRTVRLVQQYCLVLPIVLLQRKAQKLTRKVIGQLCASGAIQADDRELYEYVLNILLTGALHTLTILAIGVALGMFFECLALFISFFLIRKFAGGFHAQKGWQCYLFTIVTITGILLLIKLLHKHNDIVFYVLLTASVLLIFVLSPVDSPNKPFSENEKKVYHLRSFVFVPSITVPTMADIW